MSDLKHQTDKLLIILKRYPVQNLTETIIREIFLVANVHATHRFNGNRRAPTPPGDLDSNPSVRNGEMFFFFFYTTAPER